MGPLKKVEVCFCLFFSQGIMVSVRAYVGLKDIWGVLCVQLPWCVKCKSSLGKSSASWYGEVNAERTLTNET